MRGVTAVSPTATVTGAAAPRSEEEKKVRVVEIAAFSLPKERQNILGGHVAADIGLRIYGPVRICHL